MSQPTTMPTPDLLTALRRGWARQCPACGGNAIRRPLSLTDHCPECGSALDQVQVGSLVALISILMATSVAMAAGILCECWLDLPLWVEVVMCEVLACTVVLTSFARVKGAVIGLAMANRVQAYDPDYSTDSDPAMQKLGAAPARFPPPRYRLRPLGSAGNGVVPLVAQRGMRRVALAEPSNFDHTGARLEHRTEDPVSG
jgi:uncharacterized protein (DUF983 family)